MVSQVYYSMLIVARLGANPWAIIESNTWKVGVLTYLAGLPHHGSPLALPTCPQPTFPPEIIQ